MALSIDEELHWAAVQIPSQGGAYIEGSLVESESEDLPDTFEPFDLQSTILTKLLDLRRQYQKIFDETSAIGVSTVGIVDVERSLLLNIDRKNWKYHASENQEYIVDFGFLTKEVFGVQPVKLSVQNDAIAKCLAEYKEQYISSPSEAVPRLALAMFHDGVNGGIVRGYDLAGEPLLSFAHHEIGHVFPPIHPTDHGFDKNHSACKVHKDCYVARSGGGRIMRQWSKPLQELDCSIDGQRPWDVISHYIAHFCWGIFLTVPVDRILLSGTVIFPELIYMVVAKFESLNIYRGRRYIDKPVLNKAFIRKASLTIHEASLIGAFELARVKLLGLRAAVSVLQGGRGT